MNKYTNVDGKAKTNLVYGIKEFIEDILGCFSMNIIGEGLVVFTWKMKRHILHD